MIHLFAVSMQRSQCLAFYLPALFVAVVLLVLFERDRGPVVSTPTEPPKPETKP